MQKRRWLVVGLALSASACTSITARETPALLVNANEETRAELVSTISSALNVTNITIADDALTSDSTLVIERTPARDSTGQRLSGRDYTKAEQFRLLLVGSDCELLHVRTGERYLLPHSRCRSASSPHP
jgi:hypothetical protein